MGVYSNPSNNPEASLQKVTIEGSPGELLTQEPQQAVKVLTGALPKKYHKGMSLEIIFDNNQNEARVNLSRYKDTERELTLKFTVKKNGTDLRVNSVKIGRTLKDDRAFETSMDAIIKFAESESKMERLSMQTGTGDASHALFRLGLLPTREELDKIKVSFKENIDNIVKGQKCQFGESNYDVKLLDDKKTTLVKNLLNAENESPLEFFKSILAVSIKVELKKINQEIESKPMILSQCLLQGVDREGYLDMKKVNGKDSESLSTFKRSIGSSISQ